MGFGDLGMGDVGCEIWGHVTFTWASATLVWYEVAASVAASIADLRAAVAASIA